VKPHPRSAAISPPKVILAFFSYLSA